MYKAMIVDDEPWVVKNLLDSIDWESCGFQIVGTETNSPRALDMIRRLAPDLVLVDIRMPEISGLELMKRCSELQLETLFIVVSGFAEFSYAQKCMSLGGLGYCLKPVEEEEVVPLLRKAKEKLDERYAKDVPSVMDWVVEDTPAAREKLQQWLQGKRIDPERGLRAVVCLGGHPTEMIRHIPEGMWLYTGLGKGVLIVEADKEVRFRERFKAYEGPIRGIGISRPFHRVEGLKNAIEEAEMAALQYFMTKKPTVHEYTDPQNFSEFRELTAALQSHNMKQINRLFEQYKQQFSTGAYNIKYAFFLYNTMLAAIIPTQSSQAEGPPLDLLADVEQLAGRYQDIDELLSDLNRMAIAHLGGLYREAQIRNETFLMILRYVDRHYFENITLQTLADEFYMNRNYISQLFIKHVGFSFTDYLAKLRIRHACELLKHSRLPVHQVGERVGYHDAYYFSKIFKKLVGKTPREYRSEKMRTDE